jgi:hypothetical protein
LSTSGRRGGPSTPFEIYQRHAGAWSRDRGERLAEKAWLDRFLALLPRDAAVLDLGCGSGIPIARHLIERGIIAWDSFFHLSQADQRRMFPIFKRYAAAGAALMFTSGPSAGEQMGTYQGEPLYHASLDSAEYRQLLGENGFDVVAHVVEDPACGLHTIWLAANTDK